MVLHNQLTIHGKTMEKREKGILQQIKHIVKLRKRNSIRLLKMHRLSMMLKLRREREQKRNCGMVTQKG